MPRARACGDGNPGLAECRRLLAEQPDFKAQKTAVEAILEGHDDYRVLFTPKFHPELNSIEHVWAAMKREMRARWVSIAWTRGRGRASHWTSVS